MRRRKTDMLLRCVDNSKGADEWALDVNVSGDLKLEDLENLVREAAPQSRLGDMKLVVGGRILPHDDVSVPVVSLLRQVDQACDPDENVTLTVRVVLSACPTTPSSASRARPIVDELSLSAAKKWLAMDAAAFNSPNAAQVGSVLSYVARGESMAAAATTLPAPPQLPAPAVPAPPGGVVAPPVIPPLVWFDWSLLLRLSIGFALFSQGIPMTGLQMATLVSVSLFYYFMETGIFRHFFQKWTVQTGDMGDTDENQNQNARRNPVVRHALAIFQLSTGVPTGPGFFTDVVAFFGSFCLSLIPTWDPRGQEV